MFGSVTTTCAKCGKERKFKPGHSDGGIVCEAGHVVCSRCGRARLKDTFGTGKGLLSFALDVDEITMKHTTKCPVCSASVRKVQKADLEASEGGVSSAYQTVPADTSVSTSLEPENDEKILLKTDEVFVTNKRINLLGQQTYAITNITGVRTRVEPPLRKGPILLGVLGFISIIFYFLGSGGALFWAAACWFLAVVWWRRQRPVYHVALRSGGPEFSACHDRDKKIVDDIVSAISQAIAYTTK